MKKVLSIILAAAMLTAMVPAMLVGVSAEAATASAVSPTAAATSIGNTFPTFSGKTYEVVNVNEVIDAGRNWVSLQNNTNPHKVTWKEVWDTDFDNKNWTTADTGSQNDNNASAQYLRKADGYTLDISTTGKMEHAAKLDGVVIKTYGQDRLASPKIELSKDNVNWDVAVQTPEGFMLGEDYKASTNYVYFEFPAEFKSEEYKYVRLTLDLAKEWYVYQVYEVVLLSPLEFTANQYMSNVVPKSDDVYSVVDVNEVISSTVNHNSSSEKVNWKEIWDTDFDDKDWKIADTGSANDEYASAYKIKADGPDGLNISTVGKMERTAHLRGISIKTNTSRIGAPVIELSKDNVNWDVAINTSKSITTGLSGNGYVYFEFPAEIQNEEYEYVKISMRDVQAGSTYQIFEAVLFGRAAVTTTELPKGMDDIPVLPYSSTSNKSSYVSDREVQWNEIWDTSVDGKELAIADTGSSADNMASAKLVAGGTDGLKIETVGIMETVSSVEAVVIYTYQARFNGVTISLSKDNITYDEVIYLDTSWHNASSGYPYLYCEIPEKYASNEYKYVKMSIDGAANTVYQLYECILYTESETFEEGVTNMYAGVQAKSYTHDEKGDCYAVRFVQTVDESVLTDYVKAGFEIMADYGEGTKNCSRNTNVVYTAIVAAGQTIAAQDLKRATDTYTHEYVVALSVIDIQKSVYDDVIFTVKPYIEDAQGVRTYTGEYTVIFNDGVNMSIKGAN